MGVPVPQGTENRVCVCVLYLTPCGKYVPYLGQTHLIIHFTKQIISETQRERKKARGVGVYGDLAISHVWWLPCDTERRRGTDLVT